MESLHALCQEKTSADTLPKSCFSPFNSLHPLQKGMPLTPVFGT